MLDRTPKIFISYSWESENTKNMTIELAEALLRHGIDVVLDVWDLKPGQDMYAFMERSVKERVYNKLCNEKRDRRQNYGTNSGTGTQEN